jgi:hypothetical protein
MPVEKHAERLATPLGPRDRRLLLALALVTVAAIAAGALYAATRGGRSAGPCFTAIYPSSMGGATIHHCGSAAVHYCAVDANIVQVADACRAAGFAVGTEP